MSDKLNQFEVIINNKLLTVEFDSLTWQSSNSVLVNYDNNVILMTLIIGKELKISDFLPLTINMPENLFAVGKIPGSFNKRENRGNDYVILIARIIDRCIRPMLKNIFREIQITVNVLAINEAEEIE
jgi:polyribonucleotide nucleotidyltransferase